MRQISITINDVTLKDDLIAIEMKDFDVILGINFLRRNNAIINCYHQRVTFKPNNGENFAFKERSMLNHKMIIFSMQAQKMFANGCMGFLASAVDKSNEKKLDPTEASIVREFVKVFPEELLVLPPAREISFEIKLWHGASWVVRRLCPEQRGTGYEKPHNYFASPLRFLFYDIV